MPEPEEETAVDIIDRSYAQAFAGSLAQKQDTSPYYELDRAIEILIEAHKIRSNLYLITRVRERLREKRRDLDALIDGE